MVQMIIAMSIYSFLTAAVIFLVMLKVIPISSGVIGCILGVSFFLTALSDFSHRYQKQLLKIKRYSHRKGGEIVSFLPVNVVNYKWYKRHSKKHKKGFLTYLKRIFWR